MKLSFHTPNSNTMFAEDIAILTPGIVAKRRRGNSVICILPQPFNEFTRVLAMRGNVEIQLNKNVTVAHQEGLQTKNSLQKKGNKEYYQISSAAGI